MVDLTGNDQALLEHIRSAIRDPGRGPASVCGSPEGTSSVSLFTSRWSTDNGHASRSWTARTPASPRCVDPQRRS